MAELSLAWFENIPEDFKGKDSLLRRDSKLKRDDPRLRDFERVGFEQFLSSPPARLSIAKSELAQLQQTGEPSRSYDIDSTMIVLKSLEACRSAISIAYNAPHVKTLTNTLHFPVRLDGEGGIKSLTLHKLKNVCFGSLTEHKGFNIHIFFPHMRHGNSGVNTLNLSERTVWIDKIIIPALEKTLTTCVLQHHPSSFKEVQTKGLAKSETGHHNNPHAAPTDLRYDVPSANLGKVWDEINKNCAMYQAIDSNVPDNAFHEPIILLSMHNSKLMSKESSLLQTLERNQRYLEDFLDLSFVDKNNSYQDLGFEDIPMDNVTPITLLWKTGCIKHWMSKFENSTAGKRIQAYEYNWALTRDAGNGEFECRPSNNYFKAGLAHGKAYSINKEMSSTIPKGYTPFDNPIFEYAGLDEDTLKDVMQRSKWNGKERRDITINDIRQKIHQTVCRLRVALTDGYQKYFGVRQEYRIRINTLEQFLYELREK